MRGLGRPVRRTLETSNGRSRLIASDGWASLVGSKYGGLTGRALTGQARRKERNNRLGGLLRQLLGDQDSRHCTRWGGRDVEFAPSGKEGGKQTRLGGLTWQLLGDQDSRHCTRRGEEMWSLACQARTDKGKPAWERSRSD
ncbi:hypothetical protein ROHU_004736 [Labeo rohita]|uniref:Uncharacterized protein n=1 Tax=Labeo rohita TaxID=84645 RepID=A0A498NIV4_LABRO|nr:hypothetical protein ROHU_004736 [Labeo rohita]